MRNKIWKISTFVVLFIFALFLAIVCVKLVSYHYKLVVYPYLLELREGAVMLTTDLMLKGGNPYSFENQPQYTNTYGLLYNIVVYIFVKIFKHIVPIHRITSAFFIFLSCLILFIVNKQKKVSLLFNFSAILLFYASTLYFLTPIARPDALGLCLFLCSIFLPYFFYYSFISLFISAFLGVLAWYAKPYFILAIPYVSLYVFLFISKKKGLLYGIISFLLIFVTIPIVNYFYECYFINTFLFHVNIGTNCPNWRDLQIKMFFKMYNKGIVWLLFASLIFFIIKKLKTIVVKSIADKNVKWIFQKINIVNMSKPVAEINVDISLFCFLCSMVIMYFKLAGHRGAWMVYFFQLVLPFMIIFIFSELKKRYFNLIIIPFIAFDLYNHSVTFRPDLEKGLSEWQYVERLLSLHKNVLDSPPISSILIEQNKNVYDSGLTEYFLRCTERKSFLKYIFHSDERAKIRIEKYSAELKKMAENHVFDLAVVMGGSPFISYEEINTYYEFKETKCLLMPHSDQKWDVNILVPKIKHENEYE